MHSTQIPGNLAEGESVQEFNIPAPRHTAGNWQVVPGGPNWQIVVAESGVEVARVQLPFKASAALEQANARLIAQAPTLLADLTDAAAQLRKYETLHRAKGTPDSLEKAEVNAALAARFEATIAAAVGGA